jgi:hypothetical protein
MESCKRVVVVLRLEGLALASVCIAAYGSLGESWWWFAALILVPDLSMLGYLAGPRVGAGAYNLAHNWAVVVLWGGAAWLLGGGSLALSLPLILGSHIGIDRALGYGLKLPTGFRDTHLGRIGKAA